jgi:hypothetical protein
MALTVLIHRLPDGHDRLHRVVMIDGVPGVDPTCGVDWVADVDNRPEDVLDDQQRGLVMGEIQDFCQVCFPNKQRIPAGLVGHLQHLRDFVAADTGSVTLQQTAHVLQDAIRALHALNWRIEND